MFLRFTSRTNADGSVVRYVALAHNRRVDGRIKPDVLMNLGRVDQVDVEGLRRLAASINRHFGDGEGPDAGADGRGAHLSSMRHAVHTGPAGARSGHCRRHCIFIAEGLRSTGRHGPGRCRGAGVHCSFPDRFKT